MDTKEIEINLIWRFAAPLNIPNYDTYLWPNRWDLMELIKERSADHHQVLKHFLDCQESLQIAKDNKNLMKRNAVIYHEQVKGMQQGLQQAGLNMGDFARKNNIDLRGIFGDN